MPISDSGFLVLRIIKIHVTDVRNDQQVFILSCSREHITGIKTISLPTNYLLFKIAMSEPGFYFSGQIKNFSKRLQNALRADFLWTHQIEDLKHGGCVMSNAGK